MNENLLLHILNGEATSKEKEDFYKQLENNKKEEELFYEVKNLWLKSSVQRELSDVDSEFDELWRKIRYQKNQNSLTLGQKILRYAAIIVFVLAIGGTVGYLIAPKNFEFTDYGAQNYSATRGSVSIVEFADGTKVWLNSESKITFQMDYQNNQRLAKLSGEAYFEVVHRDDSPFIVKVGEIAIRDLGTTFNIKAYPQDNYIETSLVEGKADILSDRGESILTLKPGESAMYHTDENKMVLRRIEDNVLSAWREGKFVIRDQRLDDIFKELSRWYGIEFQFENDEIRNYRFTGNIKKTTTALHILKVLKASANFNYRIIENVNEPDIVIVY